MSSFIPINSNTHVNINSIVKITEETIGNEFESTKVTMFTLSDGSIVESMMPKNILMQVINKEISKPIPTTSQSQISV